MSGAARITGLAVGVSLPAPFVYDGRRYRFDDLPQADNDVALMVSRIQTLAQAAEERLVVETLSGGQATRGAILGAIERHLGSLASGGLFVFILEGHGTDVPDLDGDEREVGSFVDQAFPTADGPILDDDLWERWSTRPDATIFTVADTCRAETITVKAQADLAFLQGLGVIMPPGRAQARAAEPVIRQFVTSSGPSVVQFAASSRGTDAGDVPTGALLSGRFTQAVLNASRNVDNLRSYRSWFTAADVIVRSSDEQTPVLYYRGPDPALIDQRPAFVPDF